MKTILVGYDLNRAGQDYKTLIDKLESYGTWWHHLDSTWIIRTDSTAEQVRNTLGALIDKNDELLVIDISGDAAAWQGFNQKGSDWLLNMYK